jgi:hypothetical protein
LQAPHGSAAFLHDGTPFVSLLTEGCYGVQEAWRSHAPAN